MSTPTSELSRPLHPQDIDQAYEIAFARVKHPFKPVVDEELLDAADRQLTLLVAAVAERGEREINRPDHALLPSDPRVRRDRSKVDDDVAARTQAVAGLRSQISTKRRLHGTTTISASIAAVLTTWVKHRLAIDATEPDIAYLAERLEVAR